VKKMNDKGEENEKEKKALHGEIQYVTTEGTTAKGMWSHRPRGPHDSVSEGAMNGNSMPGGGGQRTHNWGQKWRCAFARKDWGLSR